MNYFLVFQNQSYNEERAGGFLWAPQKNIDGKTFFHWQNMTKVKKGDIIFSSFNKRIVSVNIALSDCFEEQRPSSLESLQLWEKDGWRVNVHYHKLDEPIEIQKHAQNIMPLLPLKYAPFNKNVEGNQGYLYEIPDELAKYFLMAAGMEHLINGINDGMESEVNAIEELESYLQKKVANTEKEQIVKGRVGQGLFKSKLLAQDNKCIVCSLAKKDLLIGSHIKPWSKSNNDERIDVHNGFLMCPTHDALYDKGYISFQDEGKIIISPQLNELELQLLRINEKIAIFIKPQQVNYIKWHRENVFKENVL